MYEALGSCSVGGTALVDIVEVVYYCRTIAILRPVAPVVGISTRRSVNKKERSIALLVIFTLNV